MKKTLLAILALSGSLFAADTNSWTLETAEYTGELADAGGKGIIFQLSDTERMNLVSTTDPSMTPPSGFGYTLESISLWTRSNKGIEAGCIYLTDSTNTIIAFSNITSSAAAGNNEVTYYFTQVSDAFTDQEAANHQNKLTLTEGESYKIFYLMGSAATINGYEKAYVGNQLTGLFQNDINEAVGYVTDATTSTVAQCGQLNGLNSVFPGVTWSPKIKVSLIAPEPATATLSLLALAGLAARRRRH